MLVIGLLIYCVSRNNRGYTESEEVSKNKPRLKHKSLQTESEEVSKNTQG